MPAWSRATFAVALAGVLLVAGVAPLHALSTGTLPDQPSTVGSHSHTVDARASVLPDSSFEIETTYRIDVQSDGDARWTINRTFRFENDSHREGFEAVAERFIEGEYSGQTVAAFEGASELVAETTGRQMDISDVSRDTRTGTDGGALLLSFTWTNFSHEESGRIHVDDAFQTEPRWFPGLSEQETLIITRPPSYQFYSASTNVQNRQLRWEGPHTFGPNRPYAVFDPISTAPPTTEPGNATTPLAERTDGLVGLLVGVIALLSILVVLGYAARVGKLPGQQPTAGSSSSASAAAGTSRTDATAPTDESEIGDRASAVEGEREATSEGSEETAESGREAMVAGEQAATEGEETDEQDEIDEELLSDEERVERLLTENGGRMKQARIVEETGWSSAKVSQLLSSMAEEGLVEKLRIGRENLISFPDEEPDQ
ncbi:DUF7345 domain-containing protein [Halapricum hydrolyticum]|uniref:Helix-turn-helix domain-containing protein n=1 Tax=Halapricum hydrolyticum TaxID=2979991 RepID=A0AAE3LJ60_9EURY|nr:helix-turn-helix domain-containing protein [Halapricum hydrolyticum]MCU4717844.1 helix-turn-helix domain-containing protein [Halapricum hydrolyticum]MCU4727008.1 helix-turn-helix domain-containing protein [Halapricum hydrolyticum]